MASGGRLEDNTRTHTAQRQPTGLGAWARNILATQARGEYAEELKTARGELVLSRVVALVWVASFMMPFAIFLFIWLAAPDKLPVAYTIVGIAEVLVFVIRALVKRHVFDRSPQLAVFLLVGCIFGPVASSICEIAHFQGDFFFAYFLIALAFVSLFPLDVAIVLAICGALFVSYSVAIALRPRVELDLRTTTNLLYIACLTVLAVVFNRILTALFFNERRARIELRQARDALLGEMEVAQQIQSLLLPAKDAKMPNHSVSGLMMPAEEVGGDYYDLVDTGTRRFFAIGDVSGHGVTSGLTMMMARTCLLGSLAVEQNASLAELYQALNTALRTNLARMKSRNYMTFVLIEDLGGGKYAAAGAHLPLMIWRKETKSVERLALEGMWLGVMDEIPPDVLKTTSIVLAPGDQMLLYTDGVVECWRDGEMFGYDRLETKLTREAGEGPEHIVSSILTDVLEFARRERDDDITLLAIRYDGVASVSDASRLVPESVRS